MCMSIDELAEDIILKIRKSEKPLRYFSQKSKINNTRIWRIVNRKNPMTVPELSVLTSIFELEINITDGSNIGNIIQPRSQRLYIEKHKN